MTALVFDKVGERYFEAGVKNLALFVGAPVKGLEGVAWNGATSVSDAPEGGDANDQYADNIKYLSLRGTENFKSTIEAFTYPEEFEVCLGNKKVNETAGGYFSQQSRQPFSYCYITQVGNDVDGVDYSEKLHIVWNATASPSEKSYETINDSPEAMTFSFDIDTTPLVVNETGFKPTAHFEITKTTANEAKYKKLIDALYGTTGGSGAGTNPGLLLPDDVITILKGAA